MRTVNNYLKTVVKKLKQHEDTILENRGMNYYWYPSERRKIDVCFSKIKQAQIIFEDTINILNKLTDPNRPHYWFYQPPSAPQTQEQIREEQRQRKNRIQRERRQALKMENTVYQSYKNKNSTKKITKQKAHNTKKKLSLK